MDARTPKRAMALALLLGAGPVFAGADACLVGRWNPVGNGAADWLQRTAPGLRVSVPKQTAVLELRRDGSYAIQAAVATRVEAGERFGEAAGRFASAGRWRSADGRLVLTPSSQAGDGRARVGGPRGTEQTLPLMVAGGAQQLAYSCSGTTLETRQAVPGSPHPIVQQYRRTPVRDPSHAPPVRRRPADTGP